MKAEEEQPLFLLTAFWPQVPVVGENLFLSFSERQSRSFAAMCMPQLLVSNLRRPQPEEGLRAHKSQRL